MKAWHFSKTNKRLDFGDDRKIILGKTLKVKGKPILCRWGLHGSVKILDALDSARSPVIWRVNITGKIIENDNKIVGTKRKAIAGGIDISDILQEFERWCALRVAHLWDAPAYAVKYLKTGNEDLREKSWEAAWSVWNADRQTLAAKAARVACVAGADTWGVAWVAAAKAADWAVRSVARAAAGGTERKEQNAKLTEMVNKALKHI